jgi:PAS domain S-box-containing protein
MKAQQEALGTVFRSHAFAAGAIEPLAQEITRLAASVVGVERANIWLFNESETELRCLDLFEASSARHTSGMVLSEAHYANEFAALHNVSHVAADDPLTDPRTSGYVEGYLKPLRITSMLDALIQFSGRRMGLLGLEHVERAHHWERDEILFACQLADQLALALLNRDRTAALARHQASEALYRSVLNASPYGIAAADLTGRLTVLSQMGEKMLGPGRAAEILGRPATDLLAPEDRERAKGRIASIFRGEKPGVAEYRGLRLDGSTFDIEVNSELIREAGGEASGIVFNVRDITETKRTREALRESSDLLQTIVETVPARIFWKGRDLRYQGCNTEFARDAGLTCPSELVGKTDYDMTWRDQAELYRADDTAVMESGISKIDYEEPQTTPDGGRIWLSTSKVPLRNERNEVSGIVGTYHDVTLRKRADEVLREALTEKESLLKEIHHRVKNNLQVINSLLRLEAGRSKEPAVKVALGEMQGRVLSVALLHETLYRTRTFGQVNLAHYLRELAQQFFRAHAAGATSTRLTLDLAPVEVRIDQGIPCGLILNELMTNSFKHAFADGPGGELKVSLRPGANHEILLEVSDTGPGLPRDFETRRSNSLGMQLVADLTRQIGGRLVIGEGPGARFEVTFRSGTAELTRPEQG